MLSLLRKNGEICPYHNTYKKQKENSGGSLLTIIIILIYYNYKTFIFEQKSDILVSLFV